MHPGVSSSDLVKQSLTPPRDDHLIAALMESLGKPATDAAGPTGDENRVASNSHSFFSFKKTRRKMLLRGSLSRLNHRRLQHFLAPLPKASGSSVLWRARLRV